MSLKPLNLEHNRILFCPQCRKVLEPSGENCGHYFLIWIDKSSIQKDNSGSVVDVQQSINAEKMI